MKPSAFRIAPLPSEVASQAREACKNGVPGHALITVDSRNAYPCRQCLRWAEPGERVILFTYASIPPGLPYSESGPIFVHELPCAFYAETGKYPSDFRAGRVIRAYDSSQNMIDAVVVDNETTRSCDREAVCESEDRISASSKRYARLLYLQDRTLAGYFIARSKSGPSRALTTNYVFNFPAQKV
jgi:hypothetical protein